MGRFVNPDNSAFQVALNSPIYVDKTGLLEYTNSVLNTTEAYICNCRPRRFGKSYAANMLAAYYSKGCNSEEMFSGLDISRESDFKTHLNKYDVIHLDIQWFLANCDNVDNVVAFITKSVQAELREIYPGVLPEEEISLSESLSRIKNIVGQKFIIIIDEWDVLIRDEAANKKVQEKYINFLRAMFKGTEPTKYIQLVYLTGILPIKKEKTQSALNNFDEFTMLDAGVMAPYIGFTEAEVKDLCERYHRDHSLCCRICCSWHGASHSCCNTAFILVFYNFHAIGHHSVSSLFFSPQSVTSQYPFLGEPCRTRIPNSFNFLILLSIFRLATPIFSANFAADNWLFSKSNFTISISP